MKSFNFKRQLKGKDLAALTKMRAKYVDSMLLLMEVGHKDYDRYLRYVSDIDAAISKLKSK